MMRSTRHWRRLAAVATLLAVGVLACGEDEPGGAPAPEEDAGATQAAPPTTGQATAECGRVAVPGHEAIGLRATGVPCRVASAVAAAAEGRGRRPYRADGFACEPADAGGGDTNYTCTRGDASIRFRYGTA
jgi:hypothetical protein